MDELKKALRDAGLDRLPTADVFGFDPDCKTTTCDQNCETCQTGGSTCQNKTTSGS